MALTILPVLSQRTYPAAGDLDDCWVVATCWAAKMVAPYLRLPDTTAFRAAAGDPDDGFQDGGSLSEIVLACKTLWPQLPLTAYDGEAWAAFLASLRADGVASLAVRSSLLPRDQQYGFTGAHQVGVAWDGTNFRLMNPLDTNGASPKAIGSAQLRMAAFGLFMGTGFRAVVLEGLDMQITAVVREQWHPTVTNGQSNGVLRAVPDRAAPVVSRVPVGSSIVTIAEIKTPAWTGAKSNGDWRLVDTGRAPMFALRSDWVSDGPPPPVIDATPYSRADLDAVTLPLRSENQALTLRVDEANKRLTSIRTIAEDV